MPVLSLPGAIQARFKASPALSFVDGGITYGKAPTFEPKVSYYVVFWQVAEQENFTTGTQYNQMKWYQFDVYAPTWDDAELIMDALTDTFNHREAVQNRILYRNGDVFNILFGTASQDHAEYPNEAGDLLRRLHKDFRFYCNRSLPT